MLATIKHLVHTIHAPSADSIWQSYKGLHAFKLLAEGSASTVNGFQEGYSTYQTELAAVGGATELSPQVMELLEALQLSPTLNEAVSCGATANAMCAIFKGMDRRTALEAEVDGLKGLERLVKMTRHRLIRIDLNGHAYVIEQVPGDSPIGNVYQTNIAVYGYKNVAGCTFKDFMDSTDNPVDLLEHIERMTELISGRSLSRRFARYLELYVTPGFVERNSKQTIETAFRKADSDDELNDTVAIRSITASNLGDSDGQHVKRMVRNLLYYAPAAQNQV